MSFFKKQRDGLEIEVHPKENESIESVIKRFRKKVNNSNILKVLKEKEFFEKPSAKNRRKRREAIERIKIEGMKKEKLVKKEKRFNEKD
jgi:small subunit ribosomal protein S21